MNRSLLEKVTASLVVTFVTALALGFILMVANLIFDWDIFPPFTEKLLYFMGISMFIVIVAATLINIMLNISRLAHYAEQLAFHFMEGHEK